VIGSLFCSGCARLGRRASISIGEWFPLTCWIRAPRKRPTSNCDWFPLTYWMRAPQAWATRSLLVPFSGLDARAAGRCRREWA